VIYTFVPYSLNRSLGQAYNSCMSLVPEKDWGLLLDDDVMFCNRKWYQIMDSYIKKYPHIGLFTCYTNRIGAKFQKLKKVDRGNDDMVYHMSIGRDVSVKNKGQVTRLKNGKIGGFAMLVSKKTWNIIGGAKKTGLKKVDWDILKKCRDNNILVARIDEIYAYHWRRGGA
jgi:hypothetical protein